MKLKQLLISSMVGVTLFTTGSAVVANASTWYKGVPSFTKTVSFKSLWISNKKHDGAYSSYAFDNSAISQGSSTTTRSTKVLSYGMGGAALLGRPYYRVMGNNTYEAKATLTVDGQYRRMILKRVGKELKVSLYQNHKWSNQETYTLLKK
ncbi:hypothetical protein [Nicoliella lavandulae]|uniref:Uncharacterized protein n=1 Tax=Nicoliella lavandulae TaxID=3082954 RepID=A0ABU8SM23_9LACO